MHAMTGLIVALFLPAIVVWLVALVSFLGATRHVRHDQGYLNRINPVVWLSQWRAKATFDERGQLLLGRARLARRWFLRYCMFLVVLLLGLALWAPATSGQPQPATPGRRVARL